VLTVITDVVNFCDLLARPENHVKVPSNQYTETPVNIYSTDEMANQMAKELMALPLSKAYVKTVTGTAKIQTLDVSQEAVLHQLTGGCRLVDARGIARQNAIRLGILRRRSEIEEEIRK